MEAFNLAEEYQCPVIVLSDLQLSLGKQTVKQLDYNRIQIKRGELIQSDIERDEDDRSYFKRYALTTSEFHNVQSLVLKVVFTMLLVLNIIKKVSQVKLLTTDVNKWKTYE